jgi:hypothetical protein
MNEIFIKSCLSKCMIQIIGTGNWTDLKYRRLIQILCPQIETGPPSNNIHRVLTTPLLSAELAVFVNNSIVCGFKKVVFFSLPTFYFRISFRIFVKIREGSNWILRGPEETDS